MHLILSLKNKNTICLVLEYPWKNFLVFLLLENFFYLRGYLSSHMQVQIFFLGGDPMKINFQMLVFWPNRSLGFQGPKLKLNVFLTLLMC